jgi:hypothetical protein
VLAVRVHREGDVNAFDMLMKVEHVKAFDVTTFGAEARQVLHVWNDAARQLRMAAHFNALDGVAEE